MVAMRVTMGMGEVGQQNVYDHEIDGRIVGRYIRGLLAFSNP